MNICTASNVEHTITEVTVSYFPYFVSFLLRVYVVNFVLFNK